MAPPKVYKVRKGGCHGMCDRCARQGVWSGSERLTSRLKELLEEPGWFLSSFVRCPVRYGHTGTVGFQYDGEYHTTPDGVMAKRLPNGLPVVIEFLNKVDCPASAMVGCGQAHVEIRDPGLLFLFLTKANEIAARMADEAEETRRQVEEAKKKEQLDNIMTLLTALSPDNLHELCGSSV